MKKIIAFIILFASNTTFADDVAKRTCDYLLPVFGDQNIAFINGGFKRDFPANEKFGQRFWDVWNNVNVTLTSEVAARCKAGTLPVLDLDSCYDKCNLTTDKIIVGSLAGKVSERVNVKNNCYAACNGAYSTSNAITATLRGEDLKRGSCSKTTEIMDSRQAKKVDDVLKSVQDSAVIKGEAK